MHDAINSAKVYVIVVMTANTGHLLLCDPRLFQPRVPGEW